MCSGRNKLLEFINVVGKLDVSIGKQIQRQRMEAGVSPEEIADAIGVTRDDVVEFESGRKRLSPAQLSALADRLGVPLSYFFSEPSAKAQSERTGRAQEAASERKAAGAATELHETGRRFRLRAEEYRTAAEACKDGWARSTYVHLAHTYDVLADRAERITIYTAERIKAG